MNLHYKDIKTAREWQAVVGLSEKEFHNLLVYFKLSYEKINQVSLTATYERLGVKQPILGTYEDCLFFILFQLKNCLTYDVLGFAFGTEHSNAQRNFERHLLILKDALESLDVFPKRQFANLEELSAYLKKESDLIMDGTEFPTARPKDNELQKKAYSGKKNTCQ